MGRYKTVNGAWKGFQQARLVIDQDGFAGYEPVVPQSEIGGKAVGNNEREVGAITTIVGGDAQVGGGDLGTRNPKGTWKIKFVNENRGDARAVRRGVEEDLYWRPSDEHWERCGSHGCERCG
jgi:hypothetical protein